jgi:hypothetical protein
VAKRGGAIGADAGRSGPCVDRLINNRRHWWLQKSRQ